MEWIRSIVAVGLGFGIFVIGSYVPRGAAGEHPGAPLTIGLVAGSIAYGAVFAALGGLTAAARAARVSKVPESMSAEGSRQAV